MERNETIHKRLFWLRALIPCFMLCLLLGVKTTALATETVVLPEIRLNSETTSVKVGELPEFSVTTTTDHAKVSEYGDNTGWSMYKEFYWSGFGWDTPFAYNDGVTHYGLSLMIDVEDGYALDSTTKIYFNGVERPEASATINSFSWGGYVTIDLGLATGEGGKCGADIKWAFADETGILTIAGTGAMKHMEIGSSTDPVPWEGFMDDIKKVDIEDGVTEIAGTAFYGADSLTVVCIPESVTKIGSKAFGNCTKLNTLMVPNTVTHIDALAFENLNTVYYSGEAKDLTEENWGASKIASNYLKASEGLVAIFEDGILTIQGEGEFEKEEYGSFEQPWASFRDQMKEVKIISETEVLPERAFYLCKNLEKVTLSSSFKTIGQEAFSECGSLKEVHLNDGVEKIEGNVFHQTNLFSLDVPKSVTTIEEYAFLGVQNINYTGTAKDTVQNFWGAIILNGFVDGSLIYEDNTKKYLVGSDKAVDTFTIPDTVEKIGYDAFSKNVRLQSIVIPESVKRIESCAFYNCSNLENVTLPKRVTNILDNAFAGTKLTAIYVPCSVFEIGENAFLGIDTVYYSNANNMFGKESWGAGQILPNPNEDAHEYWEAWETDETNHWVECVCGKKGNVGAHVFDEGVVTVEATTTEEGIKTYTCTVCGKTKTEVLDKLPVKQPEETTAPSGQLIQPEPSSKPGNQGGLNPLPSQIDNSVETTPAVELKSQKITTAKIKTVKGKSLKKKNIKIQLKAKTDGAGKLSYKVTKYPKKMKAYIKVSKKGVITLKKKAKKGTYKISITASANGDYKKTTKVVAIKVK